MDEYKKHIEGLGGIIKQKKLRFREHAIFYRSSHERGIIQFDKGEKEVFSIVSVGPTSFIFHPPFSSSGEDDAYNDLNFKTALELYRPKDEDLLRLEKEGLLEWRERCSFRIRWRQDDTFGWHALDHPQLSTYQDVINFIEEKGDDLFNLPLRPHVLDFISGGNHPWIDEVRSIWNDVRSNSWSIIRDQISDVDEGTWNERLDELQVIGLIDDEFWHKAQSNVADRVVSENSEGFSFIPRLELYDTSGIGEPSVTYFKRIDESEQGDVRVIVPDKTWESLHNILNSNSDRKKPFVFCHASHLCDESPGSVADGCSDYRTSPKDGKTNMYGSRPVIWLRFGAREEDYEWVPLVLVDPYDTPSPGENIRFIMPCQMFKRNGRFMLPYCGSFSPLSETCPSIGHGRSIVEWNGIYFADDYQSFLETMGVPFDKELSNGAGIFLHVGHITEIYNSVLKLGKGFRLSYVPSLTGDKISPLRYSLVRTLMHEIGHHLFRIPYGPGRDGKFLPEAYAQWFSNLYCMGMLKDDLSPVEFDSNQPYVPVSQLSSYLFYYSLRQKPPYRAYRVLNLFRDMEGFKDVNGDVFSGDSREMQGLIYRHLPSIINSSPEIKRALEVEHEATNGFIVGAMAFNAPKIQKDETKISPDELFRLYNGGFRPRAIPELDTCDVMATIRKACRQKQPIIRQSLIKKVIDILGYGDMGDYTLRFWSEPLDEAKDRRIVYEESDLFRIDTTSITQYGKEELVGLLMRVIDREGEYTKDELVRLLASHLGFKKVQATGAEHVFSAIRTARRRVLIDSRTSMADGIRVTVYSKVEQGHDIV